MNQTIKQILHDYWLAVNKAHSQALHSAKEITGNDFKANFQNSENKFAAEYEKRIREIIKNEVK